MGNIVNLAEFRESDDMNTFARAMKYLQSHSGTTLVVEPGTYLLTSEQARSAQTSVMNGEWGENPQDHMFNPKYEYTRGISIDGISDCKIEGYGVTLMVDGFMEPVSITNCENLVLSGIVIDHMRKPYTRGVVMSESEPDEQGNRICEIKLDCPITEKSPFLLRYVFYDTYNEQNIPCEIKSYKLLNSTHVEVVLSLCAEKIEGMKFYTFHTYHSRPAILIEHAKNITLADVTIHSQPGMGIVGNRSENVIMQRLNVIPSVGHAISTNTDATHFTSMKGVVRYENCVFEGQGDDFTNVHGYYHEVVRRESGHICWIQEKTPSGTHAQTLDYPDVGDTLELVEYDTLQLVDTFIVKACKPMPGDWMCQLELDHDLPENTEGLMLTDVTRLPYVEIVGCTASRHFARSVLIKTRGALIEGNTFKDVYGPAIVAAGEAWWYEGACPANVIIRRNRIINCARRWGEAAGIVVKADTKKAIGQSICNIIIEDNIIDAPFVDHGIFVRNTVGVKIARNKIHVKGDPIVVEDCRNVEIR